MRSPRVLQSSIKLKSKCIAEKENNVRFKSYVQIKSRFESVWLFFNIILQYSKIPSRNNN